MQSLITGNLEAKMEALRKEVQQMMIKAKETARENTWQAILPPPGPGKGNALTRCATG